MTTHLSPDPIAAASLYPSGARPVTTSFRMVDGRVRNFSGHLARLRRHAELTADDEQHIRQKLRAFGNGTYYPKIELVSNFSDWQVIRRADTPTTPQVTVWAHPVADERLHPEVKGPDLWWLMQVNAKAFQHHSSQALLKDAAGNIIEGHYSALVSFPKSRVAAISTHPQALPSTTLPLVVRYLSSHGFSIVRHEQGFKLNNLLRYPIWIVNGLHGVREVTALREYGSTRPHVRLTSESTMVTPAAINTWMWNTAEQV